MKLTQISISNFKCFESLLIENLKEIHKPIMLGINLYKVGDY